MKYDGSNIKHYEGLEGVKRRLGMYAGKTDNPNQIATEIVSNCIDEMAAGFGKDCWVTLEKDGSLTVLDQGRGIPFDVHPVYKKNTLDMTLTELHTGGKMDDKDSYKTSVGCNGVGCKLATATCEKMIVDVWRDNQHAQRIASDGKLIGKMSITENKEKHPNGTRFQYWPIKEKGVWGNTEFDSTGIKATLKGFSYFFPFATFHFNDYRNDKSESITYHNPNGVLDMYEDMAGKEDNLTKNPIIIKTDLYGIEDGLEIVFGYTNGYYERTIGYCNVLRLPEGGTHIQGFKRALTKSLNDAARTLEVLKPKDQNFKGQELAEGLIAIVSVKLRDPKFENQTKTRLSNLELEGEVYSVSYEYLKNYFEDNPKIVMQITEKLLKMRKAREAAKKAKDAILGNKTKGETFNTALSTKFSGCSERDPKKLELFVCEGSSAIGNLKQARDSKYQSLYALRGKIRNVEKVDINTIFQNQEIKDIIQILGCGFKEDFDISKLKYDKIIIASDADTD